MLWREWIVAIRGLDWFLATYTPVGMLFGIEVTGQGNVGYGAFTSIDSNTTISTVAHAPNASK